MSNHHRLRAALVAFLASTSSLYADAVDDSVNAVISKGTRASGWESETASMKAQVVARLQSMMLDNRDYSRDYNRQRDARVELLNIGDDFTIKDTMRLYRGHYYGRRAMGAIIGKTAQPLLIPLLAEDLASDEPANTYKREGEAIAGPRSVTSSEVICKLLENIEGISPDVKKWARRWSPHKPAELLDQMRAFWKRNATAFADKRYSAVVVPE